MDIEDAHIGRRLREVRSWRRLSLTAVAGLAGITPAYLSMLERGLRPVARRQTLESLAQALRVSPAELTGKPWDQPTSRGSEAHPDLVALAASLDAFELGEDPGGEVRDWLAVAIDVDRLVHLMQFAADYVTQGEMLPGLLRELHALYLRDPQHRPDVLLALTRCYSSATWVAKLLGSDGLTLMAAMRAQQCADELGSPQWSGYTTWLRGVTTGSLNRQRQYERAVAKADALVSGLDDPEVVQAYGQLHLSAALAAAAQADRDTAMTHLGEANAVADRLDVEVGGFAQVWFGKTNVGIWRTTLGLEFGDGAKVAEDARSVQIETIPSPARRAVFFANVGRALLSEKKSTASGLGLVLKAEQLAPQHIRGDVFLREAVADLLRRARRDAGGRDLRGLAWRMGIAPTG